DVSPRSNPRPGGPNGRSRQRFRWTRLVGGVGGVQAGVGVLDAERVHHPDPAALYTRQDEQGQHRQRDQDDRQRIDRRAAPHDREEQQRRHDQVADQKDRQIGRAVVGGVARKVVPAYFAAPIDLQILPEQRALAA